MRAFLLALQFLTRIPTPQVDDFRPEDLSRSAIWFPFVGAMIGGVVAAALALGALVDPWLGALAGLMVWVWITGALHLDGLADLADALGASHRDPRRFLEVLRDPHVGAFAVVAIVLVLVAKLVLLALVANSSPSPTRSGSRARHQPFAPELATPLAALALVPAWARFGAWSGRRPCRRSLRQRRALRVAHARARALSSGRLRSSPPRPGSSRRSPSRRSRSRSGGCFSGAASAA